ncbi:MAG: hypothetical protein E7547_09825 [Ruminococcaceae bacterium]|nr:hypothetical protein [Oscillospiraceae bacterium]
MRTVRINLNAENPLPDGDIIGRIGEHNATDLIITPPAEMAECKEIISYVAAFVTEGKIVRSELYPKTDKITIPLCSQLTQDHFLGFQLEGYDAHGSLIVKSDIVSELHLLPSANGDETDFDDENGGLVSQINLNSLSRHEHSNSDVLDKISEKDGVLIFNGMPAVSGGSSTKTKTKVFDVAIGEIVTEALGSVLHIYQYNDIPDLPALAEGTEIVKIEYNLQSQPEDMWTDIRDMLKFNPYCPYLIQMHKTFEYSGSIYLAVLNFFNYFDNELLFSSSCGMVSKIRVTYIDESGE